MAGLDTLIRLRMDDVEARTISTRPVRTQGPPSANNPITASDVMLLPQPDSPTSPRISPRSDLERDRRDDVDGLGRRSDRDGQVADAQHPVYLLLPLSISRKRGSRRSRKASPTRLSENAVIAIDRAGKEQQPGRARDEDAGFRQHVAPARNFRRRAEPEKIERGGAELRERKDEARLHQQRRDQIGQDVLADRPDRAGPHAVGGFDIGFGSQPQGQAVGDPAGGRQVDDADGKDRVADAATEDHDETRARAGARETPSTRRSSAS